MPSPDSYSAPAADSCSTDERLPPVTNTEPPCSKVRTGVATASSTDDSHVLPSHSKVHRQLVFVACQRRLCDQLRPQDQRATIPHVMRPLEETLTSTTSPAVSSVMKTSHGPSAVANERAYAPPTSDVKSFRARTWPTGRKLPPPPRPTGNLGSQDLKQHANVCISKQLRSSESARCVQHESQAPEGNASAIAFPASLLQYHGEA